MSSFYFNAVLTIQTSILGGLFKGSKVIGKRIFAFMYISTSKFNTVRQNPKVSMKVQLKNLKVL